MGSTPTDSYRITSRKKRLVVNISLHQENQRKGKSAGHWQATSFLIVNAQLQEDEGSLFLWEKGEK